MRKTVAALLLFALFLSRLPSHNSLDKYQVTMAIQWRDADPDVNIPDFSQLLRETSWPNAVGFIRNVTAGVSIYLSKEADRAIDSHLKSENLELGGLLLGRVFDAHSILPTTYPWITLIETCVPSHDYRNSSVSLRMGTEVWTRASHCLQSGLVVVGWYHSHPNLGVFFSGTDRATQSGFFNQPYSLGLVIDPIRRERKCFFGEASTELHSGAMVVV